MHLKCAACGAPLEVTSDMEQFACGYCGTTQVVERRGGTVLLKVLGDAIAKVQSGTDRTAAELALRRLRGDLAVLESENRRRQSLQQSTQEDNNIFRATAALSGLFSGVLSYLMFKYTDWGWSWVALAACILLIWWAIAGGPDKKNSIDKVDADRQAEHRSILKKIAEQEKILEQP